MVLAVARGLERALAQDRAQILVVVDLAIGDQEITGLVDGLPTVLRPDDREAAMGHDDRRARQAGDLDRIGAAMGDLVDHARGERFVSDIPKAHGSRTSIVFPGSLVASGREAERRRTLGAAGPRF